LHEDKETLVVIRGELLESPAVHQSHYGDKVRRNSAARFRVTEIELNKHWEPAEGRIATTARRDLGDRYFAGQNIEIIGVMKLPAIAQAPGLFDFRQYLYNQRIFYILQVDSTNDWKIISSPATPPLPEKF